LSVVPACAREQADVLNDLLLDIGVGAVFRVDMSNARHDRVDIERWIRHFGRQGLTVAAGVALGLEDAKPDLAGLLEKVVAAFELDDGPEPLVGQDVAVGLGRRLHNRATHRPVLAVEFDHDPPRITGQVGREVVGG